MICQALCQALYIFSHLTLISYNKEHETKWDKQFFEGPTSSSGRLGLRTQLQDSKIYVESQGT